MSEDRVYEIFAETRSLGVQEEERVLEVRLP